MCDLHPETLPFVQHMCTQRFYGNRCGVLTGSFFSWAFPPLSAMRESGLVYLLSVARSTVVAPSFFFFSFFKRPLSDREKQESTSYRATTTIFVCF